MELRPFLLDGFSESTLADIGRVIAAWSHLELQFDQLFLSIVVMEGAGSGKITPEKTKQMGKAFERRVRELRKRLPETGLTPDMTKRWDRVLSQLTQVRTERDRVAHSVLTPNLREDQSAQSLYKSWRNQKPYEIGTLTPKRLKKTFQKMAALHLELLLLSLDPESRGHPSRRRSH